MARNEDRPEKQPVRVYLTSPKIVAFTRFSNILEVGKQINMVRNWLIENHIQESGAPSCLYAPSLEVQCEISSFTTIDAFVEPGEVGIKWVQAEQVASINHQGDTDTIGESLTYLRKVVQKTGYTTNGPYREIYLFEVCQPKSRWVTEIQIPVVEKIRRKPLRNPMTSQRAVKT